MFRQSSLLILVIMIDVLVLFLSSSQTVQAVGMVRYAIPSGGSTNGDCLSWANACTLIRAIEVASDDEVWVKAGTYKPTSTTDRTISFFLKNGVAMYGGFAGTETERSERNWTANVTTLSGDIGKIGDAADNSYHVVYSTGPGSSAVLDGFTITGGNANGSSSPQDRGGGMYNDDYSNPILTNITFSDNTAIFGGGMVNINYSNPILTNVTFNRNSARFLGGGMANIHYSNATLTAVIFIGNTANDGGGMYNFDFSNPTLTDVTFSSNVAGWNGGGMYSGYGGSPTLTNVTFTGNTARNGGGMHTNGGNLAETITNVIFAGNTADSGGGMYIDDSPALMNVTFVGNTANDGGGLTTSSSSWATLTNVTISGNTALYDGGGLKSFSLKLKIRNSILWGNTAQNGVNVRFLTSIQTVTNSLVGGCGLNGYWGCPMDGGGNLDTDPLFVRAPSPGQDGIWASADDDYGDLRLRNASPAINAGKNDFADPSLPTTDMNNQPRIVDGTVDMGAYEKQTPNDPPHGAPDSYLTNQGILLQVSTPGVLANDGDPDPGTILTARQWTNPTNGTLALGEDGSFTYLATANFSGNVTFTYQATDGEYSTGPITVTIYVNARPMIMLGEDQIIAEGETASFNANISDLDHVPDNWAVAWDFGDSTTGTGKTVTHGYADNGVYTVTATTTDANGAQGTDTLLVTVQNVAPEVTAGEDITVLVGQPLTLDLAFTDPGLEDTHTVEITWEEGVTETINLGAGVLAFSTTHTYTMFGEYDLLATVTDKDGSVGACIKKVQVSAYRGLLPVIVKK